MNCVIDIHFKVCEKLKVYIAAQNLALCFKTIRRLQWYSLFCSEAEVAFVQKSFLCLNDLAVEDVVWVDEVNELRKATSFLEGCRVVGIDCEWKPNYIKGSKQNKVTSRSLFTFLTCCSILTIVVLVFRFQSCKLDLIPKFSYWT